MYNGVGLDSFCGILLVPTSTEEFDLRDLGFAVQAEDEAQDELQEQI